MEWKDWGWRIKRLGLTQRQACEMLKFTECSMSHWVNGKTKPTKRTIDRVENFLAKKEHELC